MDKQRRNFTLSTQILEKLDKETNKSGTVETALELYYTNKDTVRQLIQLASSLDTHLANSKPIKQLQPEPPTSMYPHGYVDPNNRKRRWDAYADEWEENV